jgi:hypothetical protein
MEAVYCVWTHLWKLILPFNDGLRPGENVCRGLPGPVLLPQYFEPVSSYGLAVSNDRVVTSDYPCRVTVRLRLRNLLIKVGSTGIKKLLVVLLDSGFSVDYGEPRQKFHKNSVFCELSGNARRVLLVVQLGALYDDRCSRRLKVLRTVLLRCGWQC